LKATLQKAIEAGRLLFETKSNLQHGQFGKWIENNLPFTERTARNYIKLYHNRVKIKGVSGLNEAYKLIIKTETVSDLEEWVKLGTKISELITHIRSNKFRLLDTEWEYVTIKLKELANGIDNYFEKIEYNELTEFISVMTNITSDLKERQCRLERLAGELITQK